MAGSFGVFRKYQRQGLAALAILAMVAFFVLPPFLDMGRFRTGDDPVVVSWRGGQMRAGELGDLTRMLVAVNRFLNLAEAEAFNRQPTTPGVFPEDDRSAVRMELLAREAAASGIVISDGAVNDYLDLYTGRRLRSEKFAELIERLRPMGLSEQGLFETLRSGLAAQTMLSLLQSGLDGEPPGWRWDFFRRLEQAAKVEVVALPVATFAADVPAPAPATLRAFFDRHKERLPDEESPETGFREPHRVKFEYLMAKQEVFEAAAAKEVTDEQIAEYYEKNKTTRFRKRPADDKADPVIAPATPETKPEEGTTEGGKKPETAPEPAKSESAPAEKKAESAPPDAPAPAAAPALPTTPVAPPQGRADRPVTVLPASFKRRADDGQPAAEGKAAADVTPPAGAARPPEPESKPPGAEAGKTDVATPPDGASKPDATVPDTPKTEGAKADAPQAVVDLEPLEKVRDEIRRTLARQAADERIDEVFSAVSRDIDRYATDVALWQARRKASGAPEPTPPDIDVIAKKHGLEAGRSALVTAVEAERSGPIGTSGEMIVDPTSRFGFRRQRWLDTMFGQGGQMLRPAMSRDAAGNRYISWVTQNQPEYVPTFEQAKEKVERRWREVEARARARAKAAEFVGQATAGRLPLAEVVKGAGLESRTVGPFTWLTQGAVPFGAMPRLSEPDGIDKPGEEFMQAVFALEPGGVATAFNEPQTVCYVVRLEAFEPPAEQLRERFVAGRKDQRRLAMVGRQQMSVEFGRWFEAFEQRQGVEWRQTPR